MDRSYAIYGYARRVSRWRAIPRRDRRWSVPIPARKTLPALARRGLGRLGRADTTLGLRPDGLP